MGITCKLNWENLHVISSQKKIIWESLVKWTQIKFKGKSNERKREISKKKNHWNYLNGSIRSNLKGNLMKERAK